MGEFVQAAPADSVKPGRLLGVEVSGVKVALANVEGRIHAFSDVCTHMQCPLSKGDLDGETVICNCHGSEFNVASGEVEVGPADDPIPVYPSRVVDGVIEVAI